MLTLAYEGFYANSMAYFAVVYSSSRSRRVRVLLPGSQYMEQFKQIVSRRGLTIQFADVTQTTNFKAF